MQAAVQDGEEQLLAVLGTPQTDITRKASPSSPVSPSAASAADLDRVVASLVAMKDRMLSWTGTHICFLQWMLYLQVSCCVCVCVTT